jgi:hypothetical protein
LKFQWLWLDHFPPGLDLTAEQRVAARQRARSHRRTQQNYRGAGRNGAIIMIVSASGLTAAFLLWIWLLLGFRGGPPWRAIAANVAGILVFQLLLWLSIAYALWRSHSPYIRRALCEMDIPVCIDCGYILRGIEAQRCPECGAAREEPASGEE